MRISTFFRRNFVSTLIVALVASIVFLLFVDVSRTSGRSISVTRIDPYVLCTEWKVIVRRWDTSKTLEIHDRFNIQENDRIRTLAQSTATLFWPDGSVTRLAEQTNISINELKKEQNNATKVNFSLTEGKTWSNIARYLDPDSHFEERFDNDTKIAAVRGTVFEINTEQGYVHTVDHAITIADNSGTVLNQVTAGSSVDINNVLNNIPPGALDLVWNTLNLSEDDKLSIQRLTQFKKLIDDYNNVSDVEKLQFILRNFFGMPTAELPFTVSSEWSNIKILVDPKKVAQLGGQDAQSVYAIYEVLSGLQDTGANVDAKIAVRDILEKIIPASERAQYQDYFARAALYESWASMAQDSPERTQKLRQSIEEYIKNGANATDLKSIQDALPKSITDAFNAQIAEWKKMTGFDILSDTEWAQKTFKLDTDSIMRDIKNFNSTIDSITSGK